VGHDPVVQKGCAERAEPFLKGAHVVDRADLKGQMVQAHVACGKPPLTLLPECEYGRAILAQKRELPPHFQGFAEHLESKDLLVELLRAREITDIQTNMAGLDARHRGQCTGCRCSTGNIHI
jgi:hypothetical protein